MSAALPRIRFLTDPDDATAEAVVVIDVIRAFTTAAIALGNGAARILCVEHTGEAHRLRDEHPDAVLMGEVRGLRPDRFDLGNSPAEPTAAVVAGRTVIQRTSNGTRGLIAAGRARHLAAAGAINAGATARWVQAIGPASVDLLATGYTGEDLACVDYIAALLMGDVPSAGKLADRVRAAADEHTVIWTRPRDAPERLEFLADIDRCAAVDSILFAMPGHVIGATTVELRRHDPY